MRPRPAPTAAPRRRARRVWPLLTLLLALATAAVAADLHATLGLDAAGPRGRLLLTDLRVPGARLADDRFALALGRADGRWGAALGWRRTAAAGPLGNLVVEGAAFVGTAVGRPGLEAAAALGLRGVIGPVALEVHGEHGTRTPFARAELDVDPEPVPLADPRLRTGAAAGSAATAVRAVATWRPDRAWTLALAPHAARTASGWTGGVEATVRRAGVADALDLSLRLDTARGAAAGHAALGLTAHHVPRRAPESRATVWIGTAPGGAASLGAEAAWAVRDGGTDALLAAGWGPAWSDRARGYALLRLSGPAGAGRVRVVAGWAGGGWRAELGGSLPLGR